MFVSQYLSGEGEAVAVTDSSSMFDLDFGDLISQGIKTWGAVEMQKNAPQYAPPPEAAPNSPLYQYSQSPTYSPMYGAPVSQFPNQYQQPRQAQINPLVWVVVAGAVGLGIYAMSR